MRIEVDAISPISNLFKPILIILSSCWAYSYSILLTDVAVSAEFAVIVAVAVAGGVVHVLGEDGQNNVNTVL